MDEMVIRLNEILKEISREKGENRGKVDINPKEQISQREEPLLEEQIGAFRFSEARKRVSEEVKFLGRV